MTATEFNLKIIPMYGAMHSVASRILGSRDDGGDVVQDVMRKLWETHEKMELGPTTASYVVRMVKNRCIDILRSGVKSVPLEAEKDAVDYAIEETDDFDRLNRLEKAMASLDDKRREILKMSVSGLKGEEIADRMSMSAANVRQMLSRTRKELKRMMTETR